MTAMKSCSCCGQEKPVSEFHIRTDRKTLQYQSICKPCGVRKVRMRRRRINPPAAPRVWKSESVRENNAFNLWHGPVSREQPLRWCA
jgi:hypothetical protein